MNRRLSSRFWLSLCLGLIAASAVLFIATQRSQVKPFWVDEDQEVVISCDQPIAKMFTDGVRNQDSAPPLYYILQRLVIRSIHHFDENILISFRAVSMAAAGLCMIVILILATPSLGLWAASIGAIVLSQRLIFHHYAAENRPYMLWVFVSVLGLATTLWISRKRVVEIKPADAFILFASGLALCLVSTPAFLQAGALLVGILVVWSIREKSFRAVPKWIWIAFALFCLTYIAIGAHFTLISARRSYGVSLPTKNLGWRDLRATHSLALVVDVLALFVGIEGIHNIVWTLLIAMGIAILFGWKYFKPHFTGDSTNQRYFIQTTEIEAAKDAVILVLFQFLAFLAIASSVYYFRYYFIQRVFIFLIALRVFAVAAGAVLVLAWAERKIQLLNKYPLFKKSALWFGVASLAMLSFVHEIHALQGHRLAFENTVNQKKAPSPCPSTSHRVVPYTDATQPDYFAPNVAIEVARDLRRCGFNLKDGVNPEQETAMIPSVETGRDTNLMTIRYEVLPPGQKPDPNVWIPITFCGKPVIYSPEIFSRH